MILHAYHRFFIFLLYSLTFLIWSCLYQLNANWLIWYQSITAASITVCKSLYATNSTVMIWTQWKLCCLYLNMTINMIIIYRSICRIHFILTWLGESLIVPASSAWNCRCHVWNYFILIICIYIIVTITIIQYIIVIRWWYFFYKILL